MRFHSQLPKMDIKINIVSTELIGPSSPTPPDFRHHSHSFISERIPHSYIPLILYYPTDFTINQSEISKWLKTSLSETLSQFYPMAGRIKDQVSIDCNDAGIFYVESQVDGDLLELINGAGAEDVQILNQLVPRKSNGSLSTNDELLAVQVNMFRCGGIAIGICQSHRIADGRTMASFILSWAANSANACGSSTRPTTVSSTLPLFNSASLFPPRNSPGFKPNPKSRALEPPLEKLVTKRFIFTSSTIQFLKSQVINRRPNAKPTRVQVVSAYIWKSCMVAKGLGEDGGSVAFHPVNLRRRFVPPLPDSSFGNIFQMAFAVANGREDWNELVGILGSAIGKLNQDFCAKLGGENGHEFAKGNFDELCNYVGQRDLHIVRFSSWCGFSLYDADFGWGEPIWLSSTSFACQNHVFLFDSKSSGCIEAWTTMAETQMPKFEQEMEFVCGCQ